MDRFHAWMGSMEQIAGYQKYIGLVTDRFLNELKPDPFDIHTASVPTTPSGPTKHREP